jgi:hypothetical protein
MCNIVNYIRMYIFHNMNINTTLLIFAVLAALGLMTALMVVEPNVAKAVGPGTGFGKFTPCHRGNLHPLQCQA